MVEHDGDVFSQVSDWCADVGHTGRHHEAVQDVLLVVVLKKHDSCVTYHSEEHPGFVFLPVC